MKFTDTQFAEAVELIQAVDPDKKRTDKRRAPRTHIRMGIDARTCIDSKYPWMVVQLRDISPRGLKLIVEKPIAEGESFLVRLPTKTGNGTQVPLVCRVAYCNKTRSGYTIGAEFIGRQTQEEPPASESELEKIRRSILD